MKTYKVVFSRLYEVPEHEVERFAPAALEEANNLATPHEISVNDETLIKEELAIARARDWFMQEMDQGMITGNSSDFSAEMKGFNED